MMYRKHVPYYIFALKYEFFLNRHHYYYGSYGNDDIYLRYALLFTGCIAIQRGNAVSLLGTFPEDSDAEE
ncbi:hypothetical protein B5X24_HaOG205831 [Helicoverpa armigera]|nr:hypothetical protein B5X24_HaOG205831 [Helicoverpa armigera]